MTREMCEMELTKESIRKYDPHIPHIVYASDDKFAEILGVSLVSLYENNQDMQDIKVYILDSGISDDNKQKLDFVCEQYKRSNLEFIPADNISEKLSMKVATDRGSLSQYARLFVSSKLPKNLKRVLYLDCDIIVNKSISGLWNLDLQGKTIGALMDAFSKYYRMNINLKPDDIMFNSGVMLIDLDRWKNENIEAKLLKFILKKRGKIQQGDQGALNAVLSHDTYCFDPCFNSVTIFYDFLYKEMLTYRKPPRFYTEKQVQSAVENPVIIHFTTSIFSKRPWMKECKHKYTAEWTKYKKKSPWKEKELWEDNRPEWKKKLVVIINVLPRVFSIYGAGIAQAYIRPIYNRVKSEFV